MTDEELATIRRLLKDIERGRERLQGIMGPPNRPRPPLLDAAIDLLAEVERLRAALREIADTHVHDWTAIDPQEVWVCGGCYVESCDYARSAQKIAREALGEESDAS